jgi:hypothetical protein
VSASASGALECADSSAQLCDESPNKKAVTSRRTPNSSRGHCRTVPITTSRGRGQSALRAFRVYFLSNAPLTSPHV